MMFELFEGGAGVAHEIVVAVPGIAFIPKEGIAGIVVLNKACVEAQLFCFEAQHVVGKDQCGIRDGDMHFLQEGG